MRYIRVDINFLLENIPRDWCVYLSVFDIHTIEVTGGLGGDISVVGCLLRYYFNLKKRRGQRNCTTKELVHLMPWLEDNKIHKASIATYSDLRTKN